MSLRENFSPGLAAPPAPAGPPPRGEPLRRTLRADPRFGYALYLPAGPGAPAKGVVVAVHDSRRMPLESVQGFRGLADDHRLAVLAPLFPADEDAGGEDGYKFLRHGPLRYDVLLHAMLDELAAELPGCDTHRVLLHGYSGGAQFVHRYLLVHPGRVRAACVGAPGEVTLIDDNVDWWAGVRDMAAVFGQPLDVPTLRGVPLLLLVGERDTETHELREQPPSRWWPSDTSRRAAHRIHRLQTLRRSLEAIGMAPQFQFMPGLAHGQGPLPAMARACAFFAGLPATAG